MVGLKNKVGYDKVQWIELQTVFCINVGVPRKLCESALGNNWIITGWKKCNIQTNIQKYIRIYTKILGSF